MSDAGSIDHSTYTQKMGSDKSSLENFFLLSFSIPLAGCSGIYL